MGWTHSFTATHWKIDRKGRRIVDVKKECDALLTFPIRDNNSVIIGNVSVIKSAMVGTTYYAAVERVMNDKPQPRQVWAAIILTRRNCNDGSLWGYKDMDETMGTYFSDCPATILALLTPTESKDANEWRKLCRERGEEKAKVRAMRRAPLYAPSGVTIESRGRWWCITSNEFRATYRYLAARYAKWANKSPDAAMVCFLTAYGTEAQRAEYAASGRACPADWKTAVA